MYFYQSISDSTPRKTSTPHYSVMDAQATASASTSATASDISNGSLKQTELGIPSLVCIKKPYILATGFQTLKVTTPPKENKQIIIIIGMVFGG